MKLPVLLSKKSAAFKGRNGLRASGVMLAFWN
jgi:hypothetical protein